MERHLAFLELPGPDLNGPGDIGATHSSERLAELVGFLEIKVRVELDPVEQEPGLRVAALQDAAGVHPPQQRVGWAGGDRSPADAGGRDGDRTAWDHPLGEGRLDDGEHSGFAAEPFVELISSEQCGLAAFVGAGNGGDAGDLAGPAVFERDLVVEDVEQSVERSLWDGAGLATAHDLALAERLSGLHVPGCSEVDDRGVAPKLFRAGELEHGDRCEELGLHRAALGADQRLLVPPGERRFRIRVELIPAPQEHSLPGEQPVRLAELVAFAVDQFRFHPPARLAAVGLAELRCR